MKCTRSIEDICGQLGEDITSEKCDQIKKKLADCPECCAYVDTIKRTVELYRMTPEKEVPDDVHKRLISKLQL